MAGRKPSADPSSAMSIYPPTSIKQKLKAQAEASGVSPATLAVSDVIKGVKARDRKAIAK
jgi:hypothetical protein